jgi:hypothetical protein
MCPVSGVRCPASGVRCPASGVRNRSYCAGGGGGGAWSDGGGGFASPVCGVTGLPEGGAHVSAFGGGGTGGGGYAEPYAGEPAALLLLMACAMRYRMTPINPRMSPNRSHPHGGMPQGERPHCCWKLEAALISKMAMTIPTIRPGMKVAELTAAITAASFRLPACNGTAGESLTTGNYRLAG